MRFWLLAVVLMLSILSGCRGCRGDACEDVTCVGGEVCQEGICVPADTPCDPACEADEVCQAGECVAFEPQCVESGEECDPSLPANEGFFCVDLDGFGPRPGQCMEVCGEGGECAFGSLCFYLAGIDDEVCSSNADCPEGKECAGGACRFSICRPSECDGFLAGNPTCTDLYGNVQGFESGAQCYNVGNGAQYCFPGGSRDLGEACANPIDAIIEDRFADTCVPGLACVDNQCRTACEASGDCSGDEDCLLADQNLVDVGVGVCGESCTPFMTGECGADGACLPVAADEGVCVPGGSKEAFEECVPGLGECEDGTICVSYQTGPPLIARCQPLCNVTVGAASDDGTVGEFAQSQRDATCPQSAPPVAYVEVVNLAQLPAAVDVYFGEGPQPRVASLGFEGRTDADPATAGAQWLEVDPGTYNVRILPAGAPSTDVPLAEATLSVASDDATSITLLPVAGATDEATIAEFPGVRDEAPAAAPDLRVRALQGLVDAPPVDLVLVPAGDDLTMVGNQIELGSALAVGAVTDFATVALADAELLVFPAGDPRTDRATALLARPVTLTPGSLVTIALRGTLDPDDLPAAGVTVLDLVAPPPVGSRGPTFTCVDLGNDVFGFCQENCGDSAVGFGREFCQGESMGCQPTFLDGNFRWANLCAPVGVKPLDEPCDPLASFSECAEGLYCLEYGNTSSDFDPVLRGRCTSYCIVGDPDAETLNCAAAQDCQRIDATAGYDIGRCGFPCTPDSDYSDSACPAGLQSCKPAASLQDDPANPDRPPSPTVEQPFCSASGDVAANAACLGNDCVPGSECMFQRSEQNTFTSTLLSQYFGAAGLQPFCAPQCDPFDGDSSRTTCAAGETCLFNYPPSAEVGHCAPIAEEASPLDACSRPGESCGEDSICVINAGAAVCLQFCQYAGPDAQGQLGRETCGAGLVCAPFVNDIGVCLTP